MRNPFSKSNKITFGEIINREDIVSAPNVGIHYTQEPEMIAKLNKVAPFLSLLRDKGMTYKQISEILELLTGMSIKPNRVRNYIIKVSPPTVQIIITDRDDEDGA
jgi:hypothetical protein